MSKPNKPKTNLSEDLRSKRDIEKEEIFQKMNEQKGQQQIIDELGELKIHDELKNFKLQDTDDPEKKYDYYYKGIERLLKQIASPKKNKEMKEAFKVLREEKNIFLNRGKRKNHRGIRGGDARMAYIGDMEIALNIISDCILSGGTPYDLYTGFRGKNIELGYYNDLNTLHAAKANSIRNNDNLNEVFEIMKKSKR
jgi:hypothetical protein